jgi:glycosyltransferase involved in cell wall biosynthesis
MSVEEQALRIAQISAGAGQMYCGTCLRDASLVRHLRRLGHDALLVPLYAPSRHERPGPSVASGRIWLGGLNLYLDLLAPAAARLLRPFRRLLDSRTLLSALGRLAHSVDAQQLGRMTVSVLAGERGPHRDSMAALADWLARQVRPDVVDLSNALLAGLVPSLRRRLSAPIVCTLSGEDLFLEELPQPWRRQAYELIADRLRGVDLCVAFNDYYRRLASRQFGVSADRIALVPLGTDMPLRRRGVVEADAEPKRGSQSGSGSVACAGTEPTVSGHSHQAADKRSGPAFPAIGFLARICPAKGAHLLCEAYELLRRSHRCRLRIAGYVAGHERRYFGLLAERLRPWLAEGTAELLGELDWQAKLQFFDSLDVFCLPAVQPEPKGLPVLEAWARAVPAVLPAHGALQELAAGGGAVLFEPGNGRELAEAIARLLPDEQERRKVGAAGQAAVADRHRAEHMARATVEVYRQAIEGRSRSGSA